MILDLLKLHQPEDNKDARSWILATGKTLRNKINFLQSKLLQTMSKDELINLLAKKVGVKLKINLNSLSVKEWLMQIKELRKKKGIGRHRLEKITSTSGIDWSKIERGEHLPSCKKLRKIVKVVDLKIEVPCDKNDFCLRSIDTIAKSFNSDWIPLIVIKGLLEIFKEKFEMRESRFNLLKRDILNSIEWLKTLHNNSKPIKAVKKVDENLAKILGAFAADGNFNRPDMLRWEDEYEEQLKVLAKWFKHSFGIKLKIRPSKRKRNSFITQITNKIIGRYFEVFFDFHPEDKRYTVNEPMLIKIQPLKIRKAFAAGALMFDGSVNLDGTVSFSSTSKKFRDSILEILLKDGIKVSISKQPHSKFSGSDKWSFISSQKLDKSQLIKLSFYFEENTLKRKIIDFYLKQYKLESINTLRTLFPKVKGNFHPIDLLHLIENMKEKEFDIYGLMEQTNLSRPTLLRYLRILEIAGFIASSRKNKRKIYTLLTN